MKAIGSLALILSASTMLAVAPASAAQRSCSTVDPTNVGACASEYVGTVFEFPRVGGGGPLDLNSFSKVVNSGGPKGEGPITDTPKPPKTPTTPTTDTDDDDHDGNGHHYGHHHGHGPKGGDDHGPKGGWGGPKGGEGGPKGGEGGPKGGEGGPKGGWGGPKGGEGGGSPCGCGGPKGGNTQGGPSQNTPR